MFNIYLLFDTDAIVIIFNQFNRVNYTIEKFTQAGFDFLNVFDISNARRFIF